VDTLKSVKHGLRGGCLWQHDSSQLVCFFPPSSFFGGVAGQNIGKSFMKRANPANIGERVSG